MKRLFSTTLAAAALLVSAMPALADGPYGYHHYRGRPGPPPYAYRHRYYEGQYWRGHRLAWRGNRWGYYRPQNGVRVFISL